MFDHYKCIGYFSMNHLFKFGWFGFALMAQLKKTSRNLILHWRNQTQTQQFCCGTISRDASIYQVLSICCKGGPSRDRTQPQFLFFFFFSGVFGINIPWTVRPWWVASSAPKASACWWWKCHDASSSTATRGSGHWWWWQGVPWCISRSTMVASNNKVDRIVLLRVYLQWDG